MTSARINRLLRLSGASKYLEIGVCQGHTFFDVDAPYKVAVDPNFLFDHRARGEPESTYVQLTSDAYFDQAPTDVFDLIFLDGLHTYEQTARDFYNSLSVSHERTIWLIDDTVPNDRFAAIPDQELCYRLRREAGEDGVAWMGDVYKLVFLIDRAMPFFHYHTFKNHPQTIVWRGAKPRTISDAGVGLDDIGAMTFETFTKHIGAMRVDDDETIYDRVSAFLQTGQESGQGRPPARTRRLFGFGR